MEMPENLAMYLDDILLNPELRRQLKNIKHNKKDIEDKKMKANGSKNSLTEKKSMRKLISDAIRKSESIHETLGVAKTDSEKMKRRNRLAQNLKKLHEMLLVEREKKEKWIQKAITKPGALHKALNVPKEKEIPAKKLDVKPGDTSKMKKRKILAQTLKKINKKKQMNESLSISELSVLILMETLTKNK